MEATNEQIDRNDLLASTRAVFVSTFVDGLESVIKLSAENLFAKAERAPSSQAQKRILEARGVLMKKSFDLKAQMKKAMEKLLHRSFQTTYSNYRPSFSNSILDGPISLIDTSAFEDELRFNTITDRFRNEAGEQLRDLNIRIALLFEQDNIRERENPFRPYMFSRAIVMAVGNVDAPPELHMTMSDQLAEDFISQVPLIYAAVNDHLAENGIAAQLMLKPKRAPEPRRAQAYDDDDDEDEFDDEAPAAPPSRRSAGGQQGAPQRVPGGAHSRAPNAAPANFSNSGAYSAPAYPQAGPAGYGQANAPAQGQMPMGRQMPQADRRQQTEPQASPVERLFNSVRAMASRPFRGKPANSAPVPDGLASDSDVPQGFTHSGFPQGAGPGAGGQGEFIPQGGDRGGDQGHAGDAGTGYGGDTGAAHHGGSGHAPGDAGADSGYGGPDGHHGQAASDHSAAGSGYEGQAGGYSGYGGASAGPGGSGGHGAGGPNGPSGQGSGSAGASYADSDGTPRAQSGNEGQAAGAGGHAMAGGGAPQAAGNGNGANAEGSTAVGGANAGDANAGGSTGSHQAGGDNGPASNGNTGDGDGDGTEAVSDQPVSSSRSRPSWLSGKKAVGDVLRRFFNGSGSPDDFADEFDDVAEGEAAPVRAAPGLLSGTVQRLIRHSTPTTSDMYAPSGEIRNLIMERRSGLNEMASNLKEQMTIDIVSMLFEFILRDTQVPAEVRAQLGRLQFLVLKIALRDESLLTTKAHPARMLVNRIGSISLGLKQVDPSGVAVTEEICRIVEAILADETENPNLFLKMLDDLDTFIARELLTQEKGVAAAVEAVEHAESRTLRLAHTCAQVSEALAGLNINEHLRDFLENDWARAIEYAERNNPAIATEYRALIPDLLWSVLPKVSEADRQKLLSLLPPILKTIHGGMEPIGWPAARKQTLMDWLFDAHTLVLRGNSTGPAPITFSAIHTHFKKFVDNPEAVPPAAPGNVTPINRKGYLEEAMRELDARINLLDHFFDDDPELQAQLQAQEDEETEAAERGEPIEAPSDISERLRAGVAIEVNLGGKPSTGRLNWINQNASNMVLTLNDHAEPSMISARMFQRLLRNDRVRFLEDEPIFERAVESLLSAAET